MTRVVMLALLCGLIPVASTRAQSTPPAPATRPAPLQPSAQAPARTPQNPPLPSAAPAAATPAPATRPAPTGANRSAEDQLRQMLQPQGNAARPLQPVQEAPPAVDQTSGQSAVIPGAAAAPVVREGTLLLDRAGRLTRSDDERTFEFTLDSDGRALADPPMILLPNRKLMALEGRVQGSYRDLRVRVSGEVMEYRGRNYLLLQRWSVVPDVAEPLR